MLTYTIWIISIGIVLGGVEEGDEGIVVYRFIIPIIILFLLDLFIVIKITDSYKFLLKGKILCCFDRNAEVYVEESCAP